MQKIRVKSNPSLGRDWPSSINIPSTLRWGQHDYCLYHPSRNDHPIALKFLCDITSQTHIFQQILYDLYFYHYFFTKRFFYLKMCMIKIPLNFFTKSFYYSIAKIAGNLWLIIFSLIKVWKCERQNYAGRSLQTLLVELLGCIWYDFHYLWLTSIWNGYIWGKGVEEIPA